MVVSIIGDLPMSQLEDRQIAKVVRRLHATAFFLLLISTQWHRWKAIQHSLVLVRMHGGGCVSPAEEINHRSKSVDQESGYESTESSAVSPSYFGVAIMRVSVRRPHSGVPRFPVVQRAVAACRRWDAEGEQPLVRSFSVQRFRTNRDNLRQVQ